MTEKKWPMFWIAVLVVGTLLAGYGIAQAVTEAAPISMRLGQEQSALVASIQGSVGDRAFEIQCQGWIDDGQSEPTATVPAVPTPTTPPAPTNTVIPPTPTNTVGPSPTPGEGFGKPFFVSASNYESYKASMDNLRPLIVYGWSIPYSASKWDSELARLQRINTPDVAEVMMVADWTVLQTELPQDADALHAAGVETLAFNIEGQMSPPEQLSAMNSTVCSQNSIAQFAALAEAYGFKSVFAPVRAAADAVPNGAIDCMAAAGLDEVGLQEQKFIEAACVPARVAAVQSTLARYAAHGVAKGNVQIMSSRCDVGDTYAASHCPCATAYRWCHCDAFVEQIEPMIECLAIWASGGSDRTDLVKFMESLRN